jgi:hypothetical protein
VKAWAARVVAVLLLTALMALATPWPSVGPVLAAEINLGSDYDYASELSLDSNIDYALRLYEEVKKVEAANTNAKELAEIIDHRILCYRRSSKPQDRVHVCQGTYLKNIVNISRKNIRSVPEIGLFLRFLQGCPMVYGLCMGEMNDPVRCRVMERQCIDCQLDRYWRGAVQPRMRD